MSVTGGAGEEVSLPAPYVPRRTAQLEEVPLAGGPLVLRRWKGDPTCGRPVTLFLHGFLDSGATWQFLVDEWPEEWPFAAVDWRGFGASPDARKPYWFPQYYADLDALIDWLSPDAPVNLVGHSMGGNIALAFAGICPERVAAVASLDGHGLPRRAPAAAVETCRQWIGQLRQGEPVAGTYPSLAAFTRALALRHPRLRPDRLAFIARAWTRDLPDGAVTVAMDPCHRLVNPVNYRRDELEACWAEIRCPLLVMLAERGEFRAALGEDGTLEGLRRTFHQGAVVELPGVTHMLHHQRPAAVARWLHAFLSGQPLPDVTALE